MCVYIPSSSLSVGGGRCFVTLAPLAGKGGEGGGGFRVFITRLITCWRVFYIVYTHRCRLVSLYSVKRRVSSWCVSSVPPLFEFWSYEIIPCFVYVSIRQQKTGRIEEEGTELVRLTWRVVYESVCVFVCWILEAGSLFHFIPMLVCHQEVKKYSVLWFKSLLCIVCT